MNFLRETASGEHEYYSAGRAIQTSTPGSPCVNFNASQEVHKSGIIVAADTGSEEKSPSDDYSSSCSQFCGQGAPETSATIADVESTVKSHAGMTATTADPESQMPMLTLVQN